MWDIPIDAIFFVDIALLFFTKYEDHGRLVGNHRAIFTRVCRLSRLLDSYAARPMQYITGWFAFDFMAAFPVICTAAAFVAQSVALVRCMRCKRNRRQECAGCA